MPVLGLALALPGLAMPSPILPYPYINPQFNSIQLNFNIFPTQTPPPPPPTQKKICALDFIFDGDVDVVAFFGGGFFCFVFVLLAVWICMYVNRREGWGKDGMGMVKGV